MKIRFNAEDIKNLMKAHCLGWKPPESQDVPGYCEYIHSPSAELKIVKEEDGTETISGEVYIYK